MPSVPPMYVQAECVQSVKVTDASRKSAKGDRISGARSPRRTVRRVSGGLAEAVPDAWILQSSKSTTVVPSRHPNVGNLLSQATKPTCLSASVPDHP